LMEKPNCFFEWLIDKVDESRIIRLLDTFYPISQ